MKEYYYNEKGVKHEVGSSMKLMSDGAKCISCPICRACKNELVDVGKWTIICEKIGKIPKDIASGKKFKCKYFTEDKKSYDYDLVMKLIQKDE